MCAEKKNVNKNEIFFFKREKLLPATFLYAAFFNRKKNCSNNTLKPVPLPQNNE